MAALNKENCWEYPRGNLAQNSNVPRSQEDYITQISKETDGRVTKKLYQDLTRKKNRILGVLSLLGDFLLNPLFQGHSITVAETSGTHIEQTRERMRTTPTLILILKRASCGARLHETLAQKSAMIWWQEFTRKSPTVPPVCFQESRKETALPVNRNSTVKTPLRPWKQTNFCWPFSIWQTTTILQIFISTLIDFPNCRTHSLQRCPRLTRDLISLSCLMNFSKRAWKFTISWLKVTESANSTLSYIDLNTIMAQHQRSWEKVWQFSEGST